MASYDLTPRIAPHLDRHLVFPILEFLQERHLHEDEQILSSKIELLNKTNMVDYAMDIHKSLYHAEEVPQGIFLFFFIIIIGIHLQLHMGMWFLEVCVSVCDFNVRRYGGEEGGGGGKAQGAGRGGGSARRFFAEPKCRAGVKS
jgi:hypothetical protein